MFYEMIGRAVVSFVRTRYQRQLRIAAAAGGGAVIVAVVLAYVLGANGEVEEG